MQEKSRFWELDFLRGIAITMMIIFHVVYDLVFFKVANIDLTGFWNFFQKPIPATFILLVGICLTISYSHAKTHMTQKQLFFKYLKRGSQIFGLGLIITLSTLIFLKDGYVFFGILHFIGVAIILGYFFLELKIWNIIFGVLLFVNGILISSMVFGFKWLVWLGFKYPGLYSVDYVPLLPWFGVILIGIFLGNTLYPNAQRIFKIKELGELPVIKQLCFLGRHSLGIYFFHHPILILVIYFLSL